MPRIKNKGERQFARWLDGQKCPYLYHPHYLRLGGLLKYQPDFLLTDTGEYVEVIGSRQAFSDIRYKLELLKENLGISVLLMRPDGSPYPYMPKRVMLAQNSLRKAVDTPRFRPAPENSLRFYRQLLGLNQYEIAERFGIGHSQVARFELFEEQRGKLSFNFGKGEKGRMETYREFILGLVAKPEFISQTIENGRAVELTR